MSRIRMMELSLRCFGLGMCGLIPLFGLAPALLAIFYFRQVRQQSGEQWNPAKRYLYAGVVCSWLGIFVFLIMLMPVLVELASGA